MSREAHTAGLKMFGEPIEADSFEARAIAAGHTLVLDEDGQIDGFVYSTCGHNGPGCSVCGWSACHHCNGEIPPCDGGAKRRKREAAERVREAAPALLEALKYVVRIHAKPDVAPENQPHEISVAMQAIQSATGEG